MMAVVGKWVLAVLMLLHGLIHLMGGVNELGWAKVSGLSGKTLFILPVPWHTFLGAAWLAVVLLFAISAIGVITGQAWWRTLAIVTALMSQVLILIWWPDAKAGTVANILVVLGAIWLKAV